MKLLAFRAHKNDPLSNVIMAVTRSSYSHAAMLLEGDEGLAFNESTRQPGASSHLIVEEFWPCARVRFLDADELAAIDVFSLTSPAGAAFVPDKAVAYAAGQVTAHLPYDWPDLLRFVALFRAVLGETPADAARRHMFCSMFVYHIVLAGGIRLLNCHDYEFSPDKLDWSPFVTPAEPLT